MIDDDVLNIARTNLERRAAALNSARFGNVFQRHILFQRIRSTFEPAQFRNCIRRSLGRDINSAAIYRLTVNDQTGANRLRQAFEEFDRPEGLVLTRNNKVADSRTVYVGSSRNIGGRLLQHLYTCADGTYALKLHRWCPDTDNSLKVEVIPVRGVADASLIQDIEDALWVSSRPMFGKLGSK